MRNGLRRAIFWGGNIRDNFRLSTKTGYWYNAMKSMILV